jgi:hypothetical protein
VVERAVPFAILPAVLRLFPLAVLAVAAIASVHQDPVTMPILINVVAQCVSPSRFISNHFAINVSEESYPRNNKPLQIFVVGDK